MADELNPGGGTGTGTGSTGASGGAPAGGAGAAGAGTGAAAVQQPSQPSGIDQLRTAYDAVKKEFEPYQKLNLKPEQITEYSSVYQKTFGEIGAIGRQLGYADDEIIEAIRENPVATLDYLRNELAAKQQGRTREDTGQDLQELISQRVEEALQPINERENARMTSEANSLFERTAWQEAANMYRQEGLDIANVPEDEVTLLLSAASEIMKYDEDALRALKYEGKTAAVQKAFTEARTMLDKYFVARMGRQGQRGAAPGGRPPVVQNNGGKKPTLDDIINDPGVINAKYAERA